MTNKPTIKRIVLIVWVVFSIVYVAYNEWNRFNLYVMQRSYQQGVADAVGKIIDESKSCKSLPVNVGDNKANLVNVECLKQAQAQGQQAQPQAPAQK